MVLQHSNPQQQLQMRRFSRDDSEAYTPQSQPKQSQTLSQHHTGFSSRTSWDMGDIHVGVTTLDPIPMSPHDESESTSPNGTGPTWSRSNSAQFVAKPNESFFDMDFLDKAQDKIDDDGTLAVDNIALRYQSLEHVIAGISDEQLLNILHVGATTCRFWPLQLSTLAPIAHALRNYVVQRQQAPERLKQQKKRMSKSKSKSKTQITDIDIDDIRFIDEQEDGVRGRGVARSPAQRAGAISRSFDRHAGRTSAEWKKVTKTSS